MSTAGQDARADVLGEAGGQRAESLRQRSRPLFDWSTEILFGQVWTDPALDVHTRRLVTIAALVGAGQWDAVTNHTQAALEADVTPPELTALAEHLMWYLGLPSAARLAGLLGTPPDDRNRHASQ